MKSGSIEFRSWFRGCSGSDVFHSDGMSGMVLVTGASGFVGGAVCRALCEKGYSVRGTGRRERPAGLADDVEYLAGDLCDTAFVQKLCEGVQVVVHAAAKAGVWGPEEDYLRANVEATEILLQSARESGVVAFVLTSTPSVVFDGKPIQGGDERMPYGESFPCAYPATKAVAERMVLAANKDDFRTLALRPHLIWGPGDNHLFPRVFDRADAGKLRMVGEGTNRVDLTYIDNVAAGHVAAVESLLAGKGGGAAYFLTQDEPVELWPWVNRVLAGTGRQEIRRKVPLKAAYFAGVVCELLWKITQRSSEPPMTRFVAQEMAKDHWFSSRAAREVLGYRPLVTMEDGLKTYLEALRNGD